MNGVGGWMDKVGIRVTQLSFRLKLKLKLNLAIIEFLPSSATVPAKPSSS